MPQFHFQSPSTSYHSKTTHEKVWKPMESGGLHRAPKRCSLERSTLTPQLEVLTLTSGLFSNTSPKY